MAADSAAQLELAHPVLLSARSDAARLAECAATAQVFDTLRAQLTELIETRHPGRKLSPTELEICMADQLGTDPDAYGTWAYFPWSRRLVRVLPEAEYVELRTSRNRNKITAIEQQKLLASTVGVAGLSVGQATALTLALEGVGGVLRLADFDTLSLSNMNRLRAGVHELGVSKAVITARAIYELNPYARIELFDDGITDANIDAFLSGLELLFEECDDLRMKVLLRERARERRIPVLMETSDRGMFDVERFDLEPTRPIFHGLAGELRAEQLTGLSTYEKVPIVLAIIGARTMSPRMASSLVDVDATLKTWPQLASAVALGGAINVDAARRIILGQLTESGRFFVDLEQVIADQKREPPRDSLVPPEPGPKPAVTPAAAPAWQLLAATPGSLPRESLVELVRAAAAAPSGGNNQPWRLVFRAGQGVLECWHDRARSQSFLDFEQRATYVAFGALAENLRLACAAQGLRARIDAFPDPQRADLICQVQLGAEGPSKPISAEDRELAPFIARRVTNRQPGPRVALPGETSRLLIALCEQAGARLQLASDEVSLSEFGDIHGATERLRVLHPVMHREMMHEIRWTPADAEATRDGIELATLELTPTEIAGMQVLRRSAVVSTLRATRGGAGLEQSSRRLLTCTSAVGLLTVRGETMRDYYRAGGALERLWLRTAALGLAFQPMTAMLYAFARNEHGGEGLSATERDELGVTRASLQRLFPVAAGESMIMAFRLSTAGPPRVRSLRRNVEELLTIV